MELAEPIERINQSLVDLFGIDVVTGLPMWRVVWSDDQFEKRLTECTDKGIFLAYPEVRDLPKYQHIPHKFILERLVLVEKEAQKELAGAKISYEPMWTFQDKLGEYLPPRVDICKFVIDTVYAAIGKAKLRHYVEDPDSPEIKERRIQEYQDYIFSDETDISDALARREGVVVPSKYEVH